MIAVAPVLRHNRRASPPFTLRLLTRTEVDDPPQPLRLQPTCFPQTMGPHPTDPAGQTTNTLFCTSTNPNGSGSGGSGSGSAGRTGSGDQTSLASSTESGTTGPGPDESAVNRGTGINGTWSGAGKPATGNTGLFGGLVGFFASAGGLVFLFGLLLLMLIALIALVAAAMFRRGPAKNWGSRFASLTHRPYRAFADFAGQCRSR